jgi:ubiquinone/menaquinone biosynthesis C-methylase UbiE
MEPQDFLRGGDSIVDEPDPAKLVTEPANRTSVNREVMATWWDEKQGEEGDLWHRTLIDPTLFRVLGPVEGQHVLDLACGNGYIARKLARSGARVTGVDVSASIIERARAREERDPLGIVYHVADAARLDGLGDAGFDVVVCNMALMDIADAKGALREAARMLRSGGRLVVSLPHPCFAVGLYHSGWAVEKFDPETTVWRKVSRYREVFQHPMIWRDDSGGEWYTPGYHRPLSWYFRALRIAGFVVSAFEEPEPTEEFMEEDSEGAWIEQIPLHCVIEAYKFKP